MSENTNQIHVTQRPDGNWQVKRVGNDRASFVAETKAEAMERARDIARNQHLELVPHNTDGRISNPNSYGNDPTPPVDQKS